LTEDEQKRLAHKYTDNMAAYDFVLKGKEYNNHFTKEANNQARQMYERAIELDPEFAFAYSLLSLTHFYEWSFGWSHDPRTLEQAFELAQRAIVLDESLPLGHAMLGQVYLWKKQHDQAIVELENAIALSPSDAKSLAILAGILNWNGRPEEAIGWIKKAMTLNPMYPAWYLWNLGHAHFLIGRYEEAIEPLERARDRNPNFLPVHVYLAASYSELGRQKEAQTEAAEVEKLSPQTSIDTWRQRLPYKDQAILDRLFISLQKAGLK
jgi:adenylate cyclase